MPPIRPLALVIIDGFGYSKNKIGNAIALAHKPNLDYLQLNYPHTLLQASGQAVGLDWGESGNSEVGHLSIGAGRIVKQYLSIINGSINDGSFFNNSVLTKNIRLAKSLGTKLHLIGLLTSGSVHSFLKHLLALLEMARKIDLPNVYLHLFTDGKDSAPKEALALLKKVRADINGHPQFKIATLMGRDFAMDRSGNWDKTQRAYNLLTQGQGDSVTDFEETIHHYYAEGITDENIPPMVLAGLPLPLITAQDSLIFFNFREDSMHQITKAFLDEDFDFFPRPPIAMLDIVTFTKYFSSPREKFVFRSVQVKNNLAEWVSIKGRKQFHIAESEKYAHVTLFFNGLAELAFEGETDFFMQSPADLAQFPEMRSKDIANKVMEELKRNYHDLFIINFANADLVSHLGNLNLVAKGIEAVDLAIGAIYHEIVSRQNGLLVITADHGNAESLIYTGTGERETKHNTSPVPFMLIADEYQTKTFSGQTSGMLPDVAPTILELMKLPIPPEMTARSLLSNLQ